MFLTVRLLLVASYQENLTHFYDATNKLDIRKVLVRLKLNSNLI